MCFSEILGVFLQLCVIDLKKKSQFFDVKTSIMNL